MLCMHSCTEIGWGSVKKDSVPTLPRRAKQKLGEVQGRSKVQPAKSTLFPSRFGADQDRPWSSNSRLTPVLGGPLTPLLHEERLRRPG